MSTFSNIEKAKNEILTYIEKEVIFSHDSQENRKKITKWIKKCLEKNDAGKWDITFKDGYKSFSINLSAPIDLTFYITEAKNG